MILLLGNNHSVNSTTCSKKALESLRYDRLIIASEKENIVLRMFDMIFHLIKYRNVINVVFIETYSSLNFYFALILSILSRILCLPYVPILHGGNLTYRLKNYPKMSELIFNHSAWNISPSLYLQDHFQKAGYVTEYIPNFIQLENYTFKKRVNCEPKLLFVRAIHEIYNPEMAIRVLSELSHKYPNSKLCMVGDFKDRSIDSCKLLAEKLGVIKQVTFTGFVSKKEWIALSSDYDIFINTTNFDNHPVSVIEAMALGFPIVSTNAGGLKYLHEDGKDCLLVKKNDVRGMKESIHALLNNSVLAESLSMNARKKAEQFSWQKVEPKWEEFLGSFNINY